MDLSCLAIQYMVVSMKLELIKKRDGRLEKFDENRIARAIFKAARSVGGEDYERSKLLAKKVVMVLEKVCVDRVPEVEEVQDIVEKILIENGHAKTAKAYILYRRERSEFRKFKNLLMDVESIIDEYIGHRDWRIKENSNMSYSLQGLNNHIATSVTAKYWLYKVYSERIREKHIDGELHIHDLGILGVYCCGWDLKDLLLKGFRGAEGKVESKPAKHLRTALGQIVNFIYTLQGEAAGAQAFSNFDTLLAPFVYYDNLNYSEVKQAIQEFVFNLNIPTRVGFQTPFSNLTMDMVVPSNLKDEFVVFGGEIKGKKYGEFQKEMDMINRAFCEVMMEGDARGRIFTFPIPTYNLYEGFNWDGEIFKYVLKMTAKYGIPYFANFINSDLSPDDVRSMCCRLRLDNRELRKRGGGLFGANPLTGSIGVVTINLPRIGYLSKDINEFKKKLYELMDIARESLIVKRKILENLTENGLYPYAKFYLNDIKERTGNYWSNHFNTIGLIGMNEALINFAGIDLTSERGISLAEDIMNFMLEKLMEFQKEDGMLYNLEATPGEGTAYRLAKIDIKKFDDIKTAGNEVPYYTNSTQLPVGYTSDPFKALILQDRLQTKYTGGTVLHLFLGEEVEDIEVCKKLIKKVALNFKLPYFTLTPTFSICPIHGYLRGKHEECPVCKKEKEMEILNQINFYKKLLKSEKLDGGIYEK